MELKKKNVHFCLNKETKREKKTQKKAFRANHHPETVTLWIWSADQSPSTPHHQCPPAGH